VVNKNFYDIAKNLVIGVVGAGFAAHCRIRGLQSIFKDELKINGIFDVSQKNALAFSKEFLTNQYSSLEEICSNNDINTVCVCTPSKYHYEIIKIALNNYKNIICEYPLAVKYENAEELVKLANNNHLFLHVGQTMNYDEDRKIIIANISKLGKLFMGYKYMSFGESDSWFEPTGYENIGSWYTNMDETGGWIITSHYHGIQLFRKIFGEVLSVSGVDSSTKKVAAGSILLRHIDGSSSVVQWGMPIPGKSFKITIVSGSKGSIEINDNEYIINTSEVYGKGHLLDGNSAYASVFSQDSQNLYDVLTGKKEMANENTDMLRNLKIAIYADKAARTGKVIDIDN
jgi:UDP-N-acetyl-2-amino-2-deoxyglucuronate dehydrogenase